MNTKDITKEITPFYTRKKGCFRYKRRKLIDMRQILVLLAVLLVMAPGSAQSTGRQKLNFNGGWLLHVGDAEAWKNTDADDAAWQRVSLPHAFNEDEAFARDIADLTDTICWYRKHFSLSHDDIQGKVFVEFEGARQGADIWLNGQKVGFSDNGVMAFGFDLTPYVKEGENVMAVRCDNSWTYRDRTLDSRYQWNDKNFNANYGGLPKNVYLHLTGKLYQTLPLYSSLGTTGTYVYATDFDIAHRKAVVHVESQVRNEDSRPRSFRLFAKVINADNYVAAIIPGETVTLQPGETRTVSIQSELDGVHFWSWGYGYLYTVKTYLAEEGAYDSSINLNSRNDEVTTRTGFRKTHFGEGKIWLNDRVIMVHGYAQRTSNEWPAVGISVPAWMSDYSNHLMVESGGNLVRWMHVTPWKQDIESCDRVGLLQAMPAGDAEKDVEGPRWTQRTQLMRDAIIYNRNNPSILFYEGGNESISREHINELKAIRDQYDPFGGRAVGSREMLDINDSEYGGEMLYINKSKKHPMWAMEYCRDEGLRKYWDELSYPFHKEGDGPLYRGKPAFDYNHNMDRMAIEMVRRWYDYWLERPGTGKRVSSGGVKIVFSDTNTHHRGESNYRTSGVTDAMRIPKDAFFAHQVMWTGWVDDEKPRTHIIGHWNYPEGTTKPVYVVSNGEEVELLLNGKSLGRGQRSYHYLFTFDSIAFAPGKLVAVSYDKEGQEMSRHQLETAGEPHHLRLSAIENPEGFKADGADMAIVEVEVVDKEGRRCPLDDRMIHFTLTGEGQWRGGIATRRNTDFQVDLTATPQGLLDAANKKNLSDNYVLSTSLPVECGVNRVLVRSTTNPGDIRIYASAEGMGKPVDVTLHTQAVDMPAYLPAYTLKGQLQRGMTPLTPSYSDLMTTVDVVGATTPSTSTASDVTNSFDDNELSEWRSDGTKEGAAITYTLERKARISEITLKLTGWRSKCYPLAVFAGKKKIWEGITPASLGYVHLHIDHPTLSDSYTIQLLAPAQDSSAFGDTKELAGGKASELDRIMNQKGKLDLRIVEIDFMTTDGRP